MAEIHERLESGKLKKLISFFEHQDENENQQQTKVEKKLSFTGKEKNYDFYSRRESNQEIKIEDKSHATTAIHSSPSKNEAKYNENIIELGGKVEISDKKVPRAYLGEIEVSNSSFGNVESKNIDSSSTSNGYEVEHTQYGDSHTYINTEESEIHHSDVQKFESNEQAVHRRTSEHEVNGYALHGQTTETIVQNGNEKYPENLEYKPNVSYSETNHVEHTHDKVEYIHTSTELEETQSNGRYSEKFETIETSPKEIQELDTETLKISEENYDNELKLVDQQGTQSSADLKHYTNEKNPTVYPKFFWDSEEDSHVLKNAVDERGHKEKVFVDMFTRRSNQQRLEICQTYEKLYHKNLLDVIRKETKGDFEELLVALNIPIQEFLAKELRKAVKGAGTCEDTLIEILCVYDDQEIFYIQEAYEALLDRKLKDDIYEDTSGDFRKILLSILSASRKDPNASYSSVAEQLCGKDSKGKTTVDADTLRTIMVSYTREFLFSVFSEYENLSGQPFGKLIGSICKGDAKKALLALYQSVSSVALFFAEELHNAFKGLGTNDSKLIRIVVSRSEVDLQDIKEAYSHLYGKELEVAVKDETSGFYRDCLLSLIEGCNKEEYRQSLIEKLPESNL